MAPNPNKANQLVVGSYNSKLSEQNLHKPQRLSMDGFQRTISDISFELQKETTMDEPKLPAISEVENANCECCEMSEECTQDYINRVRDKFSGKFICGLCAADVNEKMGKKGGKREEALEEHFSFCVKFNRLGRSYPFLYQAEAVKEILKKSSRSRAQSMSPRDKKKGSGIARSSSCIPAITREVGGSKMNNMVESSWS